MTSGPITSWKIDGETVETVSAFFWEVSKITADGDCSHEIKKRWQEYTEKLCKIIQIPTMVWSLT